MVFEPRPTLLHPVLEPKQETDMENIYRRKPEIFETLKLQDNDKRKDSHDTPWSGTGRKLLKAFKQLFEPQPDLNRLSPRLRRDAGIDELELERSTIAKAPLIR